MKVKRKYIIIAIIIISIIFAHNFFVAKAIKLTYIGEFTGGSKSCYWFCITKDTALEEPYIKGNLEIYEKIKQVDGRKYNVIISGGLPLKKLSSEARSHIGIPKYDESKKLESRMYIYIIDKHIKVRIADA